MAGSSHAPFFEREADNALVILPCQVGNQVWGRLKVQVQAIVLPGAFGWHSARW